MKLQRERTYVEALMALFPDASGRDIKGLTKFVAKLCHHKSLAPTLDIFKRCSIIRGMELEEHV